MKEKIFKYKNYKHIDVPIKVHKIERIIKNKEWVNKHGFYPFISYVINSKKFSKEIDSETNHHWKRKTRPIKYASHIDRYIYQWYSYRINQIYNLYCQKNGLNEVAIAYRTCLKGMTNVEFAKSAFDFIKKSKECYIIVSDFTSFFDYIEHRKLKENICKVLEKDYMESDLYKVFRSMTKYASIERDVIEKFLIDNKIETKESLKRSKSYFKNISWKEAKKILKKELEINNNPYGIPQGSPLSGVFANVFMIDFDKMMNKYATENNGKYMRYSDDLILIIPRKDGINSEQLWNKIQEAKKDYPYLIINKNKSSLYYYENDSIKSLHDEIEGMKKSDNRVNFLGFAFDGKEIKYRDKTITKFYRKINRRIDTMVNLEISRIQNHKKRKSKIDKHLILKQLKATTSKSRKFFDYVQHTKRVFPQERAFNNFKKSAIQKIFRRFEKKLRIVKQIDSKTKELQER